MQVPSNTYHDHPAKRAISRSFGRIHFGLLEISAGEPNCFGGIGLMIDGSTAHLEANLADTPTEDLRLIGANIYWESRVRSVIDHCCTQFYAEGRCATTRVSPVQSIALKDVPKPHCGLGSGTQMACTVAAIFAASLDSSMPLSVARLSELSLRGRRSNIGLRGFLEGGLIVDYGKDSGTSSESRTRRWDFPNWPVLIVQDHRSLGDSGDTEATMFDRCSQRPNPNRQSMLQLIEQQLLPSLATRDWEGFDQAISCYGKWAGQIFEPVQGGIYRNSGIAETIAAANASGIQGACQSSWGPTVCAIARDYEHALWCQSQLQQRLPHSIVTLTQAMNQPALTSVS